MLKIGRYGITFGRTFWVQPLRPVRVWRFLCFWFIKEVRLHDVDRKQQFPLGTLMEHEGHRFWYTKASNDVKKGKLVENHSERVNRA